VSAVSFCRPARPAADAAGLARYGHGEEPSMSTHHELGEPDADVVDVVEIDTQIQPPEDDLSVQEPG
jgi:hypothetical protein